MAVPINPVYDDWETLVNKHTATAKYQLLTDDFGANNALIAAELTSGIDHAATFREFIDRENLSPDLKEAEIALKKINSQSVGKGKDSYAIFSQEVESLKTKEPDADDWSKIIDDASKRAKERAGEIIDDAAESAKKIIGQLPERARKPAANVFSAGLTAFTAFLGRVWESIKQVAEAVLEFIKGVWRALKTAWESVESAAEIAIQAIKGIFGSTLGVSGEAGESTPFLISN